VIAVDTSAIMAILLNEDSANACQTALASESETLISAGTMAEILVVAGRRNRSSEASRLLDEFDFTVVPVTAISARQVGDAYARWGRGVHPAGLNFGDCFAYAVAKEHACGLLYLGNDFSRTDIQSVL
jgi:ribonuclease VapC